MKYIIYLLLIINTAMAQDNVTRIAVIDSGFTPTKIGGPVPLCDGDHADLTNLDALKKDMPTAPQDSNGHGTNVVYLIYDQLKELKADSMFCFAIIKFWSPTLTGKEAVSTMQKALQYVVDNRDLDIVNISGGGDGYNIFEHIFIKRILDRGTPIVAAAGNDGSTVGTYGISFGLHTNYYYPASYDKRIVVVGALRSDRATRLPVSNYANDGTVDILEVGENMNGGGIVQTGTSQATAVTTGKLVRKRLEGTR